MIQILFSGIGWTDIALTLNRVAVGMFFMFSGYHKLFNTERHRLFTDELRTLHVHAVRINQWWVPLVEFSAGGAVVIGYPHARCVWSSCHHPCRHRDNRARANQRIQSDR